MDEDYGAEPEENAEEESVYDEGSREELVEGGEISPEEAAFMKGYDDASEDQEDELDGEEE